MNTLPPEYHPATVQQDYVSDRSTAIVLGPMDGRFGIGSSTGIEIADRLFLMTAAHVLQGVTQGEDLQLVPSGFWTQRLKVHSVGLSGDGGAGFPDVAWVEIDRESTQGKNIRFLSLADLGLDQSHDAERAFLIQGYPWSEVGQEDLPKLNLLSLGAITVSRDELGVHPAAGAGRSLCLEYPPHDYQSDDFRAPPAHGISGGGVWRIPHFDDGPVWDPGQARLVAINREWNRKEGLLYATPVRFWLETLAAAKPELRPALEVSLGGRP